MMLRSWMAPHGLHIEPGQPRDADAVATLHAQGFYRGWPREDIASYLMDSETPTLVVADKKRKVLGFAMLRLLGDDAELMTIAVDQKMRGKGLGKALLEACFADLMTSSAKRMILEVAADNPAAIHLYNKLGFKQIGERPNYYRTRDGSQLDAVTFACTFE